MEELKFRSTDSSQTIAHLLIPSVIIAPLLTCLVIGGSGLTLWLANYIAALIR